MQNLIYLIPILPLLAFALIVLFANRSKRLSALLAIVMIGISWVISWLVFYLADYHRRLCASPHRIADHADTHRHRDAASGLYGGLP